MRKGGAPAVGELATRLHGALATQDQDGAKRLLDPAGLKNMARLIPT